MKTRNNLLKKCFFFSVLFFVFTAVQAQDTTSSLKDALTAKRFVFEAQTMLPLSGRSRQISTEGYQVRVSGDSLVSELPYFGRAYSVSMTGENSLRFTTTKFDYVVKDWRKGGWEITIRPKEGTDVREFIFTVSDNGFTTLQALSNNRQQISYTGKMHAGSQFER